MIDFWTKLQNFDLWKWNIFIYVANSAVNFRLYDVYFYIEHQLPVGYTDIG